MYAVLGHRQVCIDCPPQDVLFHSDAVLVGEVMESLRQDSRKTGKSVRLLFVLLLLKDHVSVAKGWG